MEFHKGVLFLIIYGTATSLFAQTTHYVHTSGGCDGNLPCYTSIQAAIDAAGAGDQIRVLPDTLYESNILITKSLDIRGVTVPPPDPSGIPSGPPVIDGDSTAAHGFIIAPGIDDVSISGFTMQNFGSHPRPLPVDSNIEGCCICVHNYTANPNENISIYDNQLKNFTFAGISFRSNGENIAQNIELSHNNIMTDFWPSLGEGSIGVNVTNCSDVGFWFNTITGLGTGIALFANALVNNVIMNDIRLYQNTLSSSASRYGNLYIGLDGTVNTARLSLLRCGENNIITASDIYGYGYGIRVSALGNIAADSGIFDFLFNNIQTNMGMGVLNETPIPLDARYCWWGSATGPSHASNPGGSGDRVSDNVLFCPWFAGSAIPFNITTPPDLVTGLCPDADYDRDKIPDIIEGDGDRDNDIVVNWMDYDPTGYFFDQATGELVSGGLVNVTGPASAVIDIQRDGHTGFYQFITDGTAGIYTIDVTLPPGWAWSETCSVQTGSFDPTGGANPTMLGAGMHEFTHLMTSTACTDFYLQFDLEPGDPFIINNNFPLVRQPIAITLAFFSAVWEEDEVVVQWTTESEANNAGFNLYRSEHEDGAFIQVNDALIPGRGSATSGSDYAYRDRPDNPGKYYYKLEDVSLSGSSTFHDPVAAHNPTTIGTGKMLPAQLVLEQNYPNPFNPETRISFTLPKSAKVFVDILNIHGECVKTLYNRTIPAGQYTVIWDGRDDNNTHLASGIYLCRMRIGNKIRIKKMSLVR